MHYSSSFYLPVIGPNIFNSTYDKTEALKYLISIYEISQGRETIIPYLSQIFLQFRDSVLATNDNYIGIQRLSKLSDRMNEGLNEYRFSCLGLPGYCRHLKYNFDIKNICFPHSSVGKESACNAGDPGSIPGSGRSTREGIGYPFQHSWASLVWLSW